jgi:hypothetical protein
LHWNWLFFESLLNLLLAISILENLNSILTELIWSDNATSCHVPDQVPRFIQFPFLAGCLDEDLKGGCGRLNLLVRHPSIHLQGIFDPATFCKPLKHPIEERDIELWSMLPPVCHLVEILHGVLDTTSLEARVDDVGVGVHVGKHRLALHLLE